MPPTVLRTFAFGAPDAGVWGAAWLPAQDGRGFACLGSGAETLLPSITLAGMSEGEDWQLLGEEVHLTLSGEGEAVVASSEAPVGGFDQLCRVRGQFRLRSADNEVECLGRRATRLPSGELDRFGSVRDVSAWFEPHRGVALTALRPAGARGHDADSLVAAILDPDGPMSVRDPRLSTTYAPSGRPMRAGLELWLDDDEEETEQFPQRATGEALGPRAASSAGEPQAQADVFRWHSQGQEGVGVYLLLEH